MMPEVFTGIREPWKGILLYGPPGTGKTLLAKAVATECKTTFMNVSSATLVSRWHGESEKMVKTLFGMARHYAPTVIFFDEIDALMMQRGGSSESDATRRLKVEMLQQMDGVDSTAVKKSVTVLATTNKPWDLDDALRRRLEKRIYIPLPDQATRAQGFKIHLSDVPLKMVGESALSDEEISISQTTMSEAQREKIFDDLAKATESYTGSDIRLICREAAMMPMRRLMTTKEPEEIGAMKASGELDASLKLEMVDFQEAIKRTAPSVDVETIGMYEAWTEEFAST